MRKYALTALVAGFGLVASLGSAKAVSIQFDYNTMFTPNPVTSAGAPGTFLTVLDLSGAGIGVPSNVRTTNLTPNSDGAGTTAQRTFNTNFQEVTTISGVTYGAETFSPVTGSDFTLTGNLKGVLTANSSTVAFHNSTVFSGPTTLTFVADDNPLRFITFSASNITTTDVGAPNALIPDGTINFLVNGSVTTTSTTPEPGAMAMVVGMAIPGSLLALRLRRRNK